jgi:hypothetical protein
VSRNLGLKWDRSGHDVLLRSAGYGVVALDALLVANPLNVAPDAHRACAWLTGCWEESGGWGEGYLKGGGGGDDALGYFFGSGGGRVVGLRTLPWGGDDFDSDLGDPDLLMNFLNDGNISLTAGTAIILEEAPGATSGLEDDESCGKSEPVPVEEVPVFPFNINAALPS